MYKLLNLLFGGDYIYWENSADSGIARVHKSNDNKIWYYRYWLTTVIDVIESPDKVIWLTCDPSKYFDTYK